MGVPPKRGKGGQTEFLQIRLDGDLKNAVIDICERNDCSLNAWLVEVLKSAVRADKGLPDPPTASAPFPTAAEQLMAYLRGDKALAPCGIEAPCLGMGQEPEIHDSMQFCKVCNIRLV